MDEGAIVISRLIVKNVKEMVDLPRENFIKIFKDFNVCS